VSTCCCKSTDARRCYEIRYPPPLGDFERSRWFEDQDLYGNEQCECGCHEEQGDEFDDEEGDVT
jgi:hypothetical protein